MDNAHKALAVAAMLVMIVSCTAILVSDQSAAAGENNESGNFGSGDVFSWTYTAADKKLVFEYTPTVGTGDMPSQGSDRVGDGDWMDLSGAVESVEFRNISGIGSCLLTGFTALTSVSTDIPITSIGGSAFFGCTSLDPSNLIADGLTSIGANAFEGTAMSGSITIPGSVTQIGKSAFENTDVRGVTFEANESGEQLTIMDKAFADCTDLETVVFEGEAVPDIGDDAFKTGPKFSVPEGSESEYGSALAGSAGDAAPSINDYVAKIGDTGYVTLSSAFDAAPADGTETSIILQENMTISESIEIPNGKNVVLNMNGKTITANPELDTRPIINYGILTITGKGTFDSSDNGGKVSGPLENYGTLIVENGTFKGNLVSATALVWNRSGGTATFNGGDYSGSMTSIATEAGSSTTITGGKYASGVLSTIENKGEMLITGGEFINTSCSTCNGGEMYGVKNPYGYTIRNGLNSDSAHLVIKPADGSEVKVTGTQGGVTTIQGTMEIYGGSFTTVDCPKKHGQAFYALYVAGETGKTSATIYDGVFTSYNRTAVYVGNSGDGGIQEEAVVVIHGGTFSVTDTSDTTKYKGIIFIDNETVNCPVAEVYGGSFSDSLPEDVIAPGYGVSNEEGQFVVDAITPEEAAASVETDGTTLYFETLADAIDYVPEGGTVTLVNDCEFGSMGISKGITLDLDGKKITVDIPDSAVYGFFFLSGDSTIKNGTIEDVTSDGNTRGGLNTVIVSEVGTSLTVQDVNISAYEPDTTSLYNYIVRAQKGAQLTLSGDTTIGEKAQTKGELDYKTETIGTVGIAVIGSSDSSYPTTATVNKGVTVDVSGFAMSGLGTSHNTLMTINGGSITSNHSTAIYHPQVGTLNIKGGVITGVTGVEIRSGTINMTGGEVHGANEGFDAEANANGTTTIAVGIAIVQHTTTNAINVNITGGTITGYRALTEANTQNNQPDPTNITISLSGGKFIGVKDDTTPNSSVTAEDVKSFIDGGTYVLADADGNEAADESLNESDVMVDGFKVGETGSIILVSGETVATINGTPYGSLEKAIDAADPGDTIVLKVDLVLSSEIRIIDSNITLDLGGHSISGADDSSRNFNLITIRGDDVTIRNGTLNGSSVTNQIVNVIQATGVKLNGLTIDNSNGNPFGYPIVVNGSEVVLSGSIDLIATFYGINLDQGGSVTEPVKLTFASDSVVDFNGTNGIFAECAGTALDLEEGSQYDSDKSGFVLLHGYDVQVTGSAEYLNENHRWVVTINPDKDGSTVTVTGSDGTAYAAQDDGKYHLPAGEFTVTASTAGYSGSKTMPLEGGVAGGTSTFSVEMSLNAPSVTITKGEQADDGSVTLSAVASHEIGVTYTYQWSDANGSIQGATAATYDAPGPGTYSVSVTASDGTKTSVAEATVTVSAPAPKYDVQIVVTPSDATVTIDGQTVTGTSVQLVAGTYQVVVSKDGYTSVTETIEVGEGLANRIEVHLEAIGPEDPDTPVYPPFIPGGDDDDVVIPPTVVVDQGSSDDDEAVKIVACAACAVVAAFLAAVMLFHRRD